MLCRVATAAGAALLGVDRHSACGHAGPQGDGPDPDDGQLASFRRRPLSAAARNLRRYGYVEGRVPDAR